MSYDLEPTQLLRTAIHSAVRKTTFGFVINLNTLHINRVQVSGDILKTVYKYYISKADEVNDKEFLEYNS